MTSYVATDLTRREIALNTTDPLAANADLRIEGRLYRALSPEYYAYLRSQMTRLKTALDAGRVDAGTYRPLADRFNAVHAHAADLFGEEALRIAMRSFNARAYCAPGEDSAVVEVATAPKRTWDGQGTLAGFAAAVSLPAQDMPVTIGQRIRTFGTEVRITGYHAPDEDFPGGWVDVVTDDGTTGQADLRFARDRHGHPIVPMTLAPDDQRAASLPDEPLKWMEAALDVSDLPEPHYYPAGDEPALRCYQPVPPSAVEQVDAIRNEAMRLGWTEAMLYQNRSRLAYPYGQEYGLVCCLDRDRVIGAITHDAIEIRSTRPHGAVLVFSRPVAGQQENP